MKRYLSCWYKRVRLVYAYFLRVRFYQVYLGIFGAVVGYAFGLSVEMFLLMLFVSLAVFIFSRVRLSILPVGLIAFCYFSLVHQPTIWASPILEDDFTVVQVFSGSSYSQLSIVSQNRTYFIVELPRYPVISRGDTLRLGGSTSSLAEDKYSDGFLEYLYSIGINRYISTNDTILIRSCNVLHQLRCSVSMLLKSYLSPENVGLVSGVLLGDDSEIGNDLEVDFQRTGLSHIVAVSGFNVTLIISAYILLARRGLIHRYVAMLITLPSLIGFLILVGVNNLPAQRATLMGVIVVVSSFLGRPQAFISSILTSVSIMFLVNPLVIKSVSFQLSVAALLGVILFTPRYSVLIKGIGSGFREIISGTIAATLATLPITVVSFGGVSLVSVLSNLIILPLIPPLMLISTAGIVLAALVSRIGEVVFWPTYLLSELIFEIVMSISQIGVSYVESREVGFFVFLVLLLLLIWGDVKHSKSCSS